VKRSDDHFFPKAQENQHFIPTSGIGTSPAIRRPSRRNIRRGQETETTTGSKMKFFIDTHNKSTGTFPAGGLTEEEFFAQFDALEEAALKLGVGARAAHVNLKEGKAFCFMCGPDEESIRKAHAAVHLPYDSITEVKRVTGADIRIKTTAKHNRR
jgi:hypothetical protein